MPSVASVSIDNKTSYAVDVYDEFDSSGDGSWPLTMTYLGTIPANSQGAVDTIRDVALLVATISASLGDLGGKFYNRFPVKLISGTPDSSGHTTPATLASTDVDAAILAFKFQRFIVANPDSQMATKFMAAVKDKKPIQAVAQFFQGTSGYKGCTLGIWRMVVTWLGNHTSGWQGDYTLYATTADGKGLEIKAVLGIKSEAYADTAYSKPTDGTLQYCKADADGKPQVYGEPASVSMGSGSTLTTPEDSDLQAKLTPVFVNPFQYASQDGTAKDQAKPQIGIVVGGTVVGAQVTSLGSLKPKDDSSDPWYKAVEKTGGSIFNNLVQLGFLLTSAIAVFEFLSKRGKKAEDEKEKDKKEGKDEKTQEDDANDSLQKDVADPPADVKPDVDGFDDNGNKARESANEVATDARSSSFQEKVQEKADEVKKEVDQELVEEGMAPTEELESAYEDFQEKIGDAKEKIKDNDFGDAEVDGLNKAADDYKQKVEDAGSEQADKVDEVVESQKAEGDRIKEVQEARDKANEEQQNEEPDPQDDEGGKNEDEGKGEGEFVEAI